MIKEITSVNNLYIKELLNLRDKNKRYSLKKFLVEGLHLVEEAYLHNRLEVILSTSKEVLNKYKIENKYLVNDSIIKKLSTTTTPQNVVGVVQMDFMDTLDDILKKEIVNIVLLDDVNDPGNLGTIIRTSAALGYDAIIASNQTVDFYNEKVLRATQGAIFKIPLMKCELISVIKKLKQNNCIVLGTSLKNSINIKELNNINRFAVVFGNEANGVSCEVLQETNKNVILPMDNDVESLNVSIAAGIIMWILKNPEF